MTQNNRQVVLTQALTGAPTAAHFAVVDAPLPDLADGHFLVEHWYISLDPFQRIAMAGRHMTSDGPLGERQVPSAPTLGRVIASRHPDFAEGDVVVHSGGWQEFSVSEGGDARKVDPERVPLSTYLGVCGMPGLTAYASIVKLADVQAGHTILVSAASGPVGATLGQIALHKGARAIGVAGSDEKCAFVKEIGFADCINYKRDDYLDRLKAATAPGADIYHDNVGGQMLTDAFSVLKDYGTVILCGLISRYNDPSQDKGFNIGLPIMKRAVMKGLVVYDFDDDYDEFLDLVAPLVKNGSFKYREDRAAGIESVGAHFARLMSGQNFGKSLVVLRDENEQD